MSRAKSTKVPPANLGIAIIAKNAEKTIGACLDSIVPYVEQVVVCVDETSGDKTAQIAKRHGAEIHGGLKVSSWHECDMHSRVLAQHFANARQASFSFLRKDLAWHGWIDADDVVEGGERITEVLAKVPAEVACVWLPYHYARAGESGPTSTLFDRERFIRTSQPWEWKYRVHEVLVPVGVQMEHLGHTRTDAIKIVHQHVGHNTKGSARRNITLLEIDLEENEEDTRAWFYLGNQYFALEEWKQSAICYEHAIATDNPYLRWQTWIYLSMVHEKLGNIGAIREAAFHAIDIQPNHPEPYYRLACSYMHSGDTDRVEFWTQFGDRLPDPPHYVFRNPLDRTYNARLILATAYSDAGMVSRARRELERAASVAPNEVILKGIETHKQQEQDILLANAYVKILEAQPQEKRNGIPDVAWKSSEVRDLIVPSIIKGRVSTQPRMIFFCGRSAESWAPPSINTTGIGGSETAVIQIAKRFAHDGWQVDVYNDCNRFEGEYDTVGYWNCNRLIQGESADVLVSWRNPTIHEFPLPRKVSLLWQHDLHSGAAVKDHLAKWDHVLGVSEWHRDYLSRMYGTGNFGFVPNGIELDRFSADVRKIPFRCVYASSPDRGLPNLLRMWKQIVANEPAAELHIAYGWENIDKYIALGHGDLAQLKDTILRLIDSTPGIVWRGRLPQDELARLYQESYALLYPTSFTETFCIVAVEAMAGGCVPVTSAVGALPNTIGEGGLVVTGNTYTQAWKDFYVLCAKAVLHNSQTRRGYAQKGVTRACELTWDNAYKRWIEIVESELTKAPPPQGIKEAVCAASI